jgi:hypothetical protein
MKALQRVGRLFPCRSGDREPLIRRADVRNFVLGDAKEGRAAEVHAAVIAEVKCVAEAVIFGEGPTESLRSLVTLYLMDAAVSTLRELSSAPNPATVMLSISHSPLGPMSDPSANPYARVEQ